MLLNTMSCLEACCCSTKHDDYSTPKDVWDNIKQFIPKDKVIWEICYGNGTSGTHLKELGFNVVSLPVDLYQPTLQMPRRSHDQWEEGDIIIVTDPPFSKCREVMARLSKLDNPYMLIYPSGVSANGRGWCSVYPKYSTNIIYDQMIIPKKRIQFIKNGNELPECNFDCVYYCYKMYLGESERGSVTGKVQTIWLK